MRTRSKTRKRSTDRSEVFPTSKILDEDKIEVKEGEIQTVQPLSSSGINVRHKLYTDSTKNTVAVKTQKNAELEQPDVLSLPFVIDTKPSKSIDEKINSDSLFLKESDASSELLRDQSHVDAELYEVKLDDSESEVEEKVPLEAAKEQQKEPPGLDPGLDMETYFTFEDDRVQLNTNSKTLHNVLLESAQSKLLLRSVITADFEQKDAIPPYKVSQRQLWKERKKLRESTTGKNWYNMSAVEMTEELRNDIKVTRMRSVLDPKRFYKGNDMTALPKFVQVGTVVDSPIDFYHSRLPKKQRKQTIVEELLADADLRRRNKKKFAELKERYRRSASKRNKKRKHRK